MEIGQRNIKIGLILLVLAGFFAFYLGFSIPNHMSNGIYGMDMARITIKAGHTHGMLIGLCNLIVGLLLLTQTFSPMSGKIASWLGIASVLLPIGLILRGLTGGALTFAPVAVTGGMALMGCFIALLMGYNKK